MKTSHIIPPGRGGGGALFLSPDYLVQALFADAVRDQVAFAAASAAVSSFLWGPGALLAAGGLPGLAGALGARVRHSPMYAEHACARTSCSMKGSAPAAARPRRPACRRAPWRPSATPTGRPARRRTWSARS